MKRIKLLLLLVVLACGSVWAVPSKDRVEISELEVKSVRKYEIKDSLQEKSIVYTDRNYSIISLPSSLVGVQYIMTANSDKLANDANFLSFTVNQPVNVYIVHDARWEECDAIRSRRKRYSGNYKLPVTK